MAEEKLLRCWNCKNVINILETKECKHPAQTQICPYCGKCLCQNPKFRQLERVDDGDGRWHVGNYLLVTEDWTNKSNLTKGEKLE